MICSIVIPAYNEQEDLPLALESLLTQDFRDVEIIVVDDGSTDGTPAMVREMFPQVTLLTQNHLGTGAARNYGARHARGAILVFTDADIIFAPGALKNLVDPIRQGQTKVANWFYERVFDPERLWSRCWQIAHHLPIGSRVPDNYDESQSHVCRAIAKDYFWHLGGFDVSKGIHDDHLSPTPVPMLRSVTVYHINPSNLSEVWQTAAWIGKGTVAKGGFGNGIKKLLLVYCFPKSIVMGFAGALRHRLPTYIFFKCYFDLAASWGIVTAMISRKTAK